MNMTTDKLKQLIKESVNEVLDEIGAIDYHDYEPIDSEVDHAGEWLNNLKDSLTTHLKHVEDDNDPNGDHYEGMFADAEKISDFIENHNISQEEKDIVNNDSELESLLGRVHQHRSGHSGAEKMYMRETWEEAISSGDLEEAIMTEKAPPGMEPWVKANKKRFINQYGKKKGLGVVYATAWKMFYKNKKKNK